MGIRVAQLEEAWTVNHAVGRSTPNWVKLTKRLQQASNPKIAGSFGSRPKIGGPVYHNNIIVGTLRIHLCPSHIRHVLRLPGAVSPDVLRFASLRITLTIPEVGITENRVTSNLPFLLDPSSITDSRLFINYTTKSFLLKSILSTCFNCNCIFDKISSKGWLLTPLTGQRYYIDFRLLPSNRETIIWSSMIGLVLLFPNLYLPLFIVIYCDLINVWKGITGNNANYWNFWN